MIDFEYRLGRAGIHIAKLSYRVGITLLIITILLFLFGWRYPLLGTLTIALLFIVPFVLFNLGLGVALSKTILSSGSEGCQIVFANESPYYYTYKERRDGTVYLIRRLTDGAYKIGQTTDLQNRLNAIEAMAGPIRRVRAWKVRDHRHHEKKALEMTSDFAILRRDGRPTEWRRMNDDQVGEFIEAFDNAVS